MIVKTESGSIYEFNEGATQVRRVGADVLRRDNEWLSVEPWFPIEVGRMMVLALEPLGEGDMTLRQTTPVVEIVA